MDDKQVEAVARAIMFADGIYPEDTLFGENYLIRARAAITAYHTSTNNREQRMREALELFKDWPGPSWAREIARTALEE